MQSVIDGTDGGFLDGIFYVGNTRLSDMILSGAEDLTGIRDLLEKEGTPTGDRRPPVDVEEEKVE